MALLAWVAMFPFSTLLSYSFSQVSFTAHCPLVVRTFLLTCFVVPYMVFGVFPFLNQRFRKWLEVGATNPAITETTYAQGQIADIKKADVC